MRLGALLIAAICLVAALILVRPLTRDHPLDQYSDDEEHFKYGSIGSETGGTLLHPIGGLLPPEPIFIAMPKVCKNVVTRTGESSYARVSSYKDFGLIYERKRDGEERALPVGISRRERLGGNMLGVNCALCHAGTVRTAPEAEARVVPGMPPQQVDVQRLFRFIFDCIQSSEFTANNVIKHIKAVENRQLGLLEQVRYRLLIPRIRGQVRDLDARIGVLTSDRVVASGPGRLDTINPGKALEVGWNLEALLVTSRRERGPSHELVGTADFPSAWNLNARDTPGFRMHWDGNFGSVEETLLSAALAVGAKPQTLDGKAFDRIEQYLRTLKPPAYPYRLDEARAAAGAGIFNTSCAECHALGSATAGATTANERRLVGRVTANDELGADSARLNAFSPLYAARLPVALNQNYARSQFAFRSVHKTGGYANVPLDGIWARAPYLHNGSVPTLRDLLQPEPCRPPRFHRGSDVYDPANVGFVSYAEPTADAACLQRPDAFRPGPTFWDAPPDAHLFVFDTRLPGNHNTGHAWGTVLNVEEKEQLLEFLKTQ